MKRNGLMVLIVFMLMLSMSLFGGGNSEESDDGAVTVTFAITGAGSWEEDMDAIVEKYNASRENVNVVVEYYAHNDYFPTMNLRLGAESDDYDIVGVDVPMVAGYVHRGWLVPLDEYFTDAEQAMFVPSALEAGSWEGKFYSPALQNSLQLLWYNKKLLAEAGLEMPETGPGNRITWEELVELAEQTVAEVDPDGSRGIYGFDFEQVSRIYQIGPLPNNLGMPSLGRDGVTADGVINSPEWIRAMNFYQMTFESGLSRRGTKPIENQDQFIAGNTVFYVGSHRITNTAMRKGMEMDHLGVALHPVFEGYQDTPAAGTGSWHLGVSAFSNHPAEAADFVKYMTLGEGNAMWMSLRSELPATRAGIEAMLEREDATMEIPLIAHELADGAYPRAITPGYSEFQTIIEATLEDIRNGANVEESLESAVDQLESQLSKYR